MKDNNNGNSERKHVYTIIVNRITEQNAFILFLESNEKLRTITLSQIMTSCCFAEFVKNK